MSKRSFDLYASEQSHHSDAESCSIFPYNHPDTNNIFMATCFESDLKKKRFTAPAFHHQPMFSEPNNPFLSTPPHLYSTPTFFNQQQTTNNHHANTNTMEDDDVKPLQMQSKESYLYRRHLQHVEYLRATVINQQMNKQNGHLINFMVKGVNGQTIPFMQVDITTSLLSDLQESIQRQLGIPIPKQRLVLKGRLLPSSTAGGHPIYLCDIQGIEHNCTFQLVCALKGGSGSMPSPQFL